MLELSQEKMFFPFTLLQPTGERKSTNTAKSCSSRDEKLRGADTLNNTAARKQKKKQKVLPESPSQSDPGTAKVSQMHFPRVGTAEHRIRAKQCRAIVCSGNLWRAGTATEIYSQGLQGPFFYKLSMCLLWKENMFFPAHHNLIHYHQPLLWNCHLNSLSVPGATFF